MDAYWSSYIIITGRLGLPGPTGPVGRSGPSGETGRTGRPGPRGMTGAAGTFWTRMIVYWRRGSFDKINNF